MLTATESWDEAVVAALIAGATLLGTDLKIGLYTNIIAPSNKLTIGDLVEPTYTGYARQLVVMTAASRDLQQGIVTEGGVNSFAMTGTPVPTLVQGYFLTFGAGPALLGIEPLATPYQMNDPLDALNIIVRYIETNGNQGLATIIT